MKTTLLALVFGFAWAATLHASPRTSTNYTITTDGFDDGGLHTSSAAYTNDSSTGGFASPVTAGGETATARSGFLGQLYEIIGIAITAQSTSVTAGGNLQLAALQTADDGTLFAVPASLPVEWFFNGTVITGATGPAYTLPSMQRFNAGDYSARMIGADGSNLIAAATPFSVTAPPANDARLLNLSTRALCQTGDNVLIPGFVLGGTGTKRLLIRAVGPTLAAAPFNFGSAALPDPRMTLRRRNSSTGQFENVAANNDWGSNTNVAAITQTSADLFAFPLTQAKDAALLLDLPAGEYTVVTDDVAAASGIAIVELYDADSGAPTSNLVNISNRGFAGVGDQVVIPGFVVSSEGPKTFLVRVVGPTLGAFGVSGTMADPQLAVFNSNGTQIFSQNDWGGNPDAAYTAQTAAQVFAFPLGAGSKDAAFVVTLQPGAYTIIGSAADGVSTGVVLVEVYVVP